MQHRSLDHLRPYLGPGETIHLYFRPCLAHIQFDISVCLIAALFSTVFFWGNFLFLAFLWAIFGLIVIYFLLHYWSTEYFITEKALYHKYFFWMTQVRYLHKGDILEMNVKNHFFERWISRSGTIYINSPSGQNWEMNHVRYPLEKKNFILKLWSD